jgi:hypothetical protein
VSLPSSPPLAPDLATEVRRLADRLRALGPARLARPLPPYACAADAGHAVAQALADLAAPLESRAPTVVPRLTDGAVGDQVAVCGNDLIAALSAGDDPAMNEIRQRAIELLRELRLRL